MRKYIAIIIASLALFTGQAHAQRCLPKMQGIEVRANMADGFNPGGNDGGYSFGAALSTYTKKGNKWVFGGEYLLKNNPYKDTSIPVAQFTAEGGYYFKILSDARKIVFVYAGASALAGYESVITNWTVGLCPASFNAVYTAFKTIAAWVFPPSSTSRFTKIVSPETGIAIASFIKAVTQ